MPPPIRSEVQPGPARSESTANVLECRDCRNGSACDAVAADVAVAVDESGAGGLIAVDGGT
jgi:hypothetical protein